MFNLQNITRKNIWSLTPYRCARDDYNTGILLDANENTHGSAITNSQDLNRYPDPHLSAFKASFCQFRGLEQIGLFVGVGSDECIDLLLRCFCVPGVDEIVICPPTYGMYTVSAQTNDVGVIRANLNSEFQLDIPLVSSYPLIPLSTFIALSFCPCKFIPSEFIEQIIELIPLKDSIKNHGKDKSNHPLLTRKSNGNRTKQGRHCQTHPIVPNEINRRG
jgi:hypothetical protein